jgi:hypothetical protein
MAKQAKSTASNDDVIEISDTNGSEIVSNTSVPIKKASTKPKAKSTPAIKPLGPTDVAKESTPTLSPPDPSNTPTKPATRLDRIKAFIKTHHTRLLIAFGVLIVLPTAVWAYWTFTRPTNHVSTDVHVQKKAAPKPTTKASPLTGLAVDPALADRPITSVIIENHPDARPQSGLSQAGVVYEALAEGGITRFQAFFLENRPAVLGPVRSVRTYFVDWALEFQAPVAHVGGNADALDLIGPLHMKDMNEFSYGSSFYRSKDRYAPHNAYTSSDALDALEQKLGYNTPASFKPSPRTTKDTPANPAPHANININYSYNGYQVEYKFDPTCDCYQRFLAGQPHIDRNTNQQIAVKNVVVEYMPTSYGTTRSGEQTVIMQTPGTGKMIVFRDGQAIEGTWSKAGHSDRTKLVDVAGKEVPLNKGNTWYSIVPTDKIVSY